MTHLKRLTDIEGAFTGCNATGRNISFLIFNPPFPVATGSKMWVCGHMLPGIPGSKLGGMNKLLLVGFSVYCKEVVPSTGRSLVQRNPTLCGVSECDLDISTMKKHNPIGPSIQKEKYVSRYHH